MYRDSAKARVAARDLRRQEVKLFTKPATVSANPPNPAMRHLPALTVHTLPNAQEKQKENCCMNVH